MINYNQNKIHNWYLKEIKIIILLLKNSFFNVKVNINKLLQYKNLK